MAAITVPPPSLARRQHEVAAPSTTRRGEETSRDDFWHRFGRAFIVTGSFFAVFLFVGCFLITILGGGSVAGGLAIGGMAALWGTPCFGALFAANLASDD